MPIANGQTEIVRLLLDHGASPTYWPSEIIGTILTPIEIAASRGHQDIVDLLLERGAKALSHEETLQLRLIEAAELKDINEIDKLLGLGARINSKNRAEETALLAAIKYYMGSQEEVIIIKHLIDKGADLNLKGMGRFCITPPLHDLVGISSVIEKHGERWYPTEVLLKEFLIHGAFVSGRDENEKTPLHIAAELNGIETAKILLIFSAKVMPRDKDNKTPLDYAESAEMIDLLKSYGAKEQ